MTKSNKERSPIFVKPTSNGSYYNLITAVCIHFYLVPGRTTTHAALNLGARHYTSCPELPYIKTAAGIHWS